MPNTYTTHMCMCMYMCPCAARHMADRACRASLTSALPKRCTGLQSLPTQYTLLFLLF